MGYNYDFPRPSVTVDSAVLRITAGKVQILLIKRGREPFKGRFALPGGFLEIDEEPLTGAKRELAEETGLTGIPLRPLFTCGQTGRDPRGRCITMVFGALVRGEKLSPRGGDDADQAEWFGISELPGLAFDHDRVIREISEHFFWQASTAVIGRTLLEGGFSAKDLNDLQGSVLDLKAFPSAETFFERAERLLLISHGPEKGKFQWRDGSETGLPDWVPLVW